MGRGNGNGDVVDEKVVLGIYIVVNSGKTMRK